MMPSRQLAVHVAGYFRHAIIGKQEDSPVVMGGQLSAGLAWLGVGLPTAIKLNDKTWLTSHPGLRTTVHPVLQLPLGLSFQTGDNRRVDTELGAQFSTKDHDSWATTGDVSPFPNQLQR